MLNPLIHPNCNVLL